VESDLATVRTLRDKIVQAASANCNDPVLDIKLIVAGRNLQVRFPGVASQRAQHTPVHAQRIGVRWQYDTLCDALSVDTLCDALSLHMLHLTALDIHARKYSMQDLDKSLKDCGVTATSCILVLKHADSQQKRQMDAAAERDRRIKRLKHAVDAMAARGERRSQYSLQVGLSVACSMTCMTEAA